MGLPSKIRGWARSRRKVLAVASVGILAWLVAFAVMTERSRRATKRVESLNGLTRAAFHFDAGPFRQFIQFGPVEWVYLLGPKTGDGELEVLDDFPRLKTLTLTNTRVGDEGLARLARFENLNCLSYGYIDHSKLIGAAGKKLDTRPMGGGKGLAALKGLPNLQVVGLYGPGTSDDDVEGLVQLKHLVSLDLMNTRVTDEGFARLKKALPKCIVRRR